MKKKKYEAPVVLVYNLDVEPQLTTMSVIKTYSTSAQLSRGRDFDDFDGCED